MKTLKNIIKDSLNETAEIIKKTEKFVLVKFKNYGEIEYATYRYNANSIYYGHYFTTIFTSEKQAKMDAINDFYARTL
ncbi:hypothetical protein [Mammaliicoccus vitulinus]|uniref:hypothetical protein n=1 Tax=Mammaliicoccus vitulinus TaxID=71237 RepID=UPI00248C8D28|nr:hypothetical protein [Mammaliicoccus vitulinus]